LSDELDAADLKLPPVSAAICRSGAVVAVSPPIAIG
jgi:hypothetical protein